MKQDSFKVSNAHGIDLTLNHTIVATTDHTGTRPGDDEATLIIPDVEEYDTDLIQDGCLILHFDKAQCRKLGWLLIRMAGRLKTADERTMEDFAGLPLLPPELEKAWRK